MIAKLIEPNSYNPVSFEFLGSNPRVAIIKHITTKKLCTISLIKKLEGLIIMASSKFIQDAISIYPSADKKVLSYIETFVEHSNVSSTINLFSNGYCYAFAHILQSTFNKGTVCWVAPFSHMIWLYKNVPYDINGVYDGESTMFIPESFLHSRINGFKHIPNYKDNTTKNDIDHIISEFIESKKQNHLS